MMPFERVSLDLITDLPECDEHDVVVVFVCMLTKRMIVEPITTTITTKQLAKVMHRAVFRHHFGLPRKLISDRDPRFISDFWKTRFRAIATKLDISTTYHRPHRTSELDERASHTMLYVHFLHDDRVQDMTNVEFAINAAAFTSTTMSPFKATLGFEPTSPKTTIFEDSDPMHTFPWHVKILVEMHRSAHDYAKATHAHMQEFANRHRSPIPCTVGDKVNLKAANP
jgi:hypothetical protein